MALSFLDSLDFIFEGEFDEGGEGPLVGCGETANDLGEIGADSDGDEGVLLGRRCHASCNYDHL